MRPGDTITVDGLDMTVTGLPHPDATGRAACIDVDGETRFVERKGDQWVEFWPPTGGVWTKAHAIARRIVHEVIGGAA